MPQHLVDGLFVSSLIFFNILCLLGIFSLIYVLVVLNKLNHHVAKLSAKAIETFDHMKHATEYIGEFTGHALGTFARMRLFRPRKKKSLISSFLRYFLSE